MPRTRTGGNSVNSEKLPHSTVRTIAHYLLTYFLLLTIGGGSEEHKHPSDGASSTGWMDGWMDDSLVDEPWS
jgi:hypothetical protein